MTNEPRDTETSTDKDTMNEEEMARQLVNGGQPFETMVETILDGFVSYDREWRYVYINQKAAQMMGRKKEELIGKTIFELFPERVDTPIFREFQRIMMEGQPAQLQYFSPGARRWLRTNFYPSQDGMITFLADMTEEQKLEETTQLLTTLTQNIVDAVIITNIDYTVTSWNKGAETLYGWEANEAIGKSVADLISTEFPNNPNGRSESGQVLATLGHWQGEVIQKRKNDAKIDVFASVANVQDSYGTVVGGIAVNRDITEFKRIEKALQESEAKLTDELAVMTQLQQISSQLIQDNNITTLYEKVLDAAIFIMRSDMGSMQMLDPEKQELLLLSWRGFDPASAQFWERVRIDAGSTCGQTLRTGERVIVSDVETCGFMAGTDDLRFYRLAGIRAVQTTPLFSRTGTIVGMISTHWREEHQPSERELRRVDLLARQAADMIENVQTRQVRDEQERALALIEEQQRKRLDNIIATVPGIIWENQYDPKMDRMTLRFISAYVKSMFGHTPEEALAEPLFWYKLIHPENLQIVLGEFAKVRESGKAGIISFRALHKDGHSIDVEAHLSAILKDDKAVGTRGVMLDISERQRLMKEQARYATRLSRSNAELQQFAYIASHDLQEPLRMVISYLQLLESRYVTHLDEEAHEFIAFAVDGATRMKALIIDLLSYAQVDSDDKVFEQANIQAALDQAIKNLSLTIQDSHAFITYDDMPSLKADPIQLTRVFQNLLDNAIKFRRETIPEIHISVERKEHEWQFAIHDNGIGIAPQYQDRIFMIFQRLHRQGEYTGKGIGLAICKKVIERHGGRIWVETTVGHGTTFYFTIPA